MLVGEILETMDLALWEDRLPLNGGLRTYRQIILFKMRNKYFGIILKHIVPILIYE